jgi:hypothetical protein
MSKLFSHFGHFILSRPPAYWIVPPTFRASLSSLTQFTNPITNLLWKHPYRHTQNSLDIPQSSQADNQINHHTSCTFCLCNLTHNDAQKSKSHTLQYVSSEFKSGHIEWWPRIVGKLIKIIKRGSREYDMMHKISIHPEHPERKWRKIFPINRASKASVSSLCLEGEFAIWVYINCYLIKETGSSVVRGLKK